MRKLGVLPLILAVAVLIVLITVKAEIQSSPLKQFNITPEILRLNWTNDYSGNITLKLNTSFPSVVILVLNDTTGLSENYTQSNSLTDCQSGNLKLTVRNTTHIASNYQNVSNGTNVDVRLVNTLFTCKPGRYSTATFTFRNSTQTNETANTTIYLDLPIATFNTLSSTTGIGSFGGSVPANATEYQSYFFETSNITNATSVVINMSGWSSNQDIDIFLFDNSSTPLLQAKSINKTATNEYLIFNFLPSTGKMWEIRIYGNSTSSLAYNGNILFSGLNATNTSSSNLQISLIDFGIRNASTVSNFNITLRNEANLTHTSVVEEKEIYYVKRFTSSGATNFTLIVPDSSIASKVAVGLNWTGGSNYSFNVVNTSNAVVLKSPVNGSYRLANVSGANQELWNETTSVGSVAGAWTIQVLNNTPTSTDSYTVTAYVYVTISSWLASNYSSMTFNRTGNANFTGDVSINLTIPNNTLDGFYEGTIKYRDSNKAGISIPFRINVTAPVVAINGTLTSKTFTIDENIGANLTRTMFFELNNSGSVDATITILNSSNMSCASSSCSGYNGSLSFNTTTSLGKQSSQLIVVNLSYNSSMPFGVYEGWLYFNSTHNTVSLSSHPYSTFNATIRLNLTSNLTLNMLEIKSMLGNLVTANSSAENVTIRFKVNYINGTETEAQNALNTSNFSVWLVNKNISSFRIPTSGSLSLFNGTNPIYLGNDYELNATIPADTVGGFYEVHVLGNYTKNPTYAGEGTNTTFIVNNTGLQMSTNASSCSFGNSCSASITMGNSSTTKIHVNVSNFGNIAASSIILTYSESCVGYSLSAPIATTACSAGDLSGTATISPAANSTGCIVTWTVTANSSANSACTGSVSGSNSTKWYNANGINISIDVTANATSGTTTTGTGAGGAATTTTTPPAAVYLEFSSYPSTVSLEQGNSTTSTVNIKNSNNTVGQNIAFTIADLNSSWYSISPTGDIKLAAGQTANYTVTFTVPSDAEVKDYAGTFKATSNYTTLNQSFILKVTPGETLKVDIDKDIADWETKITDLEKEINSTIKKGWNTSNLETKLADLKSKFAQAKSLKDSGDYRGAFDLLKEIDSLYNETSNLFEEVKKANQPSLLSYLKWIIVAVVVIGIAVLGYLFWPQKGYTPSKGYTPPQKEKEQVKSKLQENYEKLKEKWKFIKKKD